MNDFMLGQHAASIRALQEDMTAVKGDTRQILILMAEKKGERRTMVKLGAGVGAVAGSLVTMVGKVLMIKLGWVG